ncbi:DUF4123 domain-containing protein [Vibrio scophthalmi]|uniref:DUF4123 domain-containing protein n=1 Tax=Vibrio scophthalmi TaxID=45658 RepID=A0A1E3WMT5_9VIBR|nr:DUF4123 domain-containing protein [Vibrio scophthalmi]ODS11093.1 hypothetical protein VSF3289_01358 [Vibrio scophthalmi]
MMEASIYKRVAYSNNTYLIIDGAKIDDLPMKLALIDSSESILPLYAGTPFSDLISVSPYLIQVKRLEDYESILSNLIDRSACIIIESDKSFLELVSFWKKRLIVNIDSNTKVLFRLYDPDILHRLLITPKTTPNHQFLGPCQRVLYNVDNQWYDYELHKKSSDKVIDEALTLSGSDYEALSMLRKEHTFSLLSEHITQYFPDMVDDELEATMFAQHIQGIASSLGFSTEQSLFFFANVWCYLGSECLDFNRYPNIAELLTKASAISHLQRIERAARLASQYAQNVTHSAKTYLH